MNRIQRRLQVLDLYRRSLRSAARCPRPEHRLQMKLITRLKFRENLSIKDPQIIDNLIKTGEEELASMDYYHNIRESRNNSVKEVSGTVDLSSPNHPSSMTSNTPSKIETTSSSSSSSTTLNAAPNNRNSTSPPSSDTITNNLSITESTLTPSKKKKTTGKRTQKTPALLSSASSSLSSSISSAPSPNPTTNTHSSTFPSLSTSSSPSLPSSLPSSTSSTHSNNGVVVGLIPEDLLEHLSLSLGKLHYSLQNSTDSNRFQHQYNALRNITVNIDQAAVAIAQGYTQAYGSLQQAHSDTQRLVKTVSVSPSSTHASIQTLADISLSLKQLLAHLHKYNQIEGSSLSPHPLSSSSSSPSVTNTVLSSSPKLQ